MRGTDVLEPGASVRSRSLQQVEPLDEIFRNARSTAVNRSVGNVIVRTGLKDPPPWTEEMELPVASVIKTCSRRNAISVVAEYGKMLRELIPNFHVRSVITSSQRASGRATRITGLVDWMDEWRRGRTRPDDLAVGYAVRLCRSTILILTICWGSWEPRRTLVRRSGAAATGASPSLPQWNAAPEPPALAGRFDAFIYPIEPRSLSRNCPVQVAQRSIISLVV